MTRRSVAIVIQDGVEALDVTGLLDVFAETNRLLPLEQGYDVVVIGPEARAYRASNGLAIIAELAFADARMAFDEVLVAGEAVIIDGRPDKARDDCLRDRTRRNGDGVIRAGAPALERARVPQDIPAASTGVDIALSLVSDHHGRGVALACARRVASPRRTSALDDFGRRPAVEPAERPIDRVVAHILANLGAPLSMDRLAAVALVSVRSLARLFAAEIGMTPHEFVEGRRLDLARRLLVEADMGLKVLAHRCGFGGAEQMRVVFQRRLGLSPTAYRDQVRAGDWQDNASREPVGPAAPRVIPLRPAERPLLLRHRDEPVVRSEIRFPIGRAVRQAVQRLDAA